MPKHLTTTILMILVLMSSNSIAGNRYHKIEVEYGKQLLLQISSVGINRISFAPERITRIIGDISNYSSLLTDKGSELFLTSKLAAGKNFNISVILASGGVIDITAQVIESSQPKVIKLLFSKSFNAFSQEQAEARLMIKAMEQNNKGKYYVESVNNTKFILADKHKSLKGVTLEHYCSYKFGDLRGVCLELTNQNKGVINLDAKTIAQEFENVESLAIRHSTLQSRKKTQLFIVFRRGQDV